MKTTIQQTCYLLFVVIIFTTCKPEQTYTESEMQATLQYAYELANFFTGDTTQLHTGDLYSDKKSAISTVYLVNDSGKTEQFKKRTLLHWWTYNSRDRYKVQIISSLGLFTFYTSDTTINLDDEDNYFLVTDNTLKDDTYSFNIITDIKIGYQPTISEIYFYINGYGDELGRIYINKPDIQLDADSIELISEKDRIYGRCRVVFKRNKGIVSIYDYDTDKTWKLAE